MRLELEAINLSDDRFDSIRVIFFQFHFFLARLLGWKKTSVSNRKGAEVPTHSKSTAQPTHGVKVIISLTQNRSVSWKGVAVAKLDLEVCEVWIFVPAIVSISLGYFMAVPFRIVMLDDSHAPFSRIGVCSLGSGSCSLCTGVGL